MFLFFFFILLFVYTSGKMQAQESDPLVGAIRWDAWYGNVPDSSLPDPASRPGMESAKIPGPNPGGEAARNLKPQRWEYRRPFFSREDDHGNLLEINGNRQEVMDQEIEYAAEAGLDFWAFTVYPEDCPLSWCLKKYLSSTQKEKIKFCFFLVCNSSYGRFVDDPAMQEYVLRSITEPTYLKVQGNRPVLYLGFVNDEIDQKLSGGFWRDFCAKVESRGLGKPYVIAARGRTPSFLKKYIQKIGADAVGNYCITDGKAEGVPYQRITDLSEQWLKDCRKAGLNVSPLCMAGWDRRPRFMNPTSWEKWHKKGEFMERYIQRGTPEEIASHIGRNVDFLKKSPNPDGVNLVLIYAWNECDEGGWIIPTIPAPRGEGSARLDAIRKILRP